MDAERWREIDRVLQSALELEGEQRLRFVVTACGQDEELRREVEALLEAFQQQDNFLSQPAVKVAARIIAEDQTERETSALNHTPPGAPPYDSAVNQTLLKLLPGTLVDNRYQIERELGRGGMGVVFLAKDQKLDNRQAVIKVMLEEHLNDQGQQNIGRWLKQKFNDEKKALARLRHPGIVHPTDAGELPGGRAYLVMEYVPGRPLRKEISSPGMELRRAAKLIHQIAQALAAAHEAGIIHRDLKPENILLLDVDGEEQIRLIDFGIAAVRDNMITGSPPTTRVVGTGAYMAPEQLRGKPEAASDIYALGVIACELVTGRRPLNVSSVIHLRESQREGVKIKLRELRADLPEAAEAAILKALAFDPAKRQKDAREFGNQFRQAIEAVDPFQTNVSVSAQEETLSYSGAPPTQRFPSRWRFPVPAGAVMAVIMMVGLVAWQNLRLADGGNSVDTPSNRTTELPTAPERSLVYSLTVQKNPSRYPRRQPFTTLGDISVEEGDGLRLKLSSPQTGHLYIINEWPPQPNRPPGITVLFPNPNDNRGSAKINANQVVHLPPDNWLRFVEEKGVEKYWLVWAEQRAPELEALTPDDAGEIHNRGQIEAVKQFLNARLNAEFKAEPDETRQQIKLTGKTNVLVGLIKLNHR